MARDGSGQYHRPPGTDGIPNTTIASAKYNTYVADVEQDLNLPRPIVAGGTGAANAHDAMIALSGEIAGQVVTNYDSFPFVAGSFYSAPGATSAPNPSYYFVGIAYALDANNITLEARQIVGAVVSTLYVRQKSSGTWSAWAQQAGSTADLDAAYVNVAGDIMSGPLSINGGSFVGSGAWPFVVHLATDVNFAALNNAGAAYVGVFTDAGAGGALELVANTIKTPGLVSLTDPTGSTSPSTGALTVAGGVGVGGALNVGGGLKVNNVPSANPYGIVFRTGVDLNLNVIQDGAAIGLYGTNDAVSDQVQIRVSNTLASSSPTTGALTVAGGVGVGGNIRASGELTVGYDGDAGVVRFGNAGKYIYWNSAVFSINGDVSISSTTASTSPTTGALTVAGGVGISGQVWSSAEITSMKTLNSLPGDAALAAQIGGTTSAPRIKMWGELGAGIGGKILFNTGNGGMIDCGSGGSIRIASNGSIMTIIDSSGNLSVTTKGYQPGGGSWAASSDARIKNELGEYTRGLADVTALRPVYYTYKGNDTAAEPAAGKDAEGNALPVAVPYANSPHGVVAASATKYAGLIAQEVEGIFPEMVTKTAGYIDGAAVSDLRTLDTTPLIFALINAVKELKARVEELEAA